MPAVFNDHEIGRVVDLVWWLRGYLARGGGDLGEEHLEVLLRIRNQLLEAKEERERGKADGV
jgi:hypothetical protein